jgi:hypothetical protein
MAKTPEISSGALNRELDGVVQRANIGGLSPKAQSAANQFKALKESTLAAEVGSVAGGFESLTAEVDDIEGLEEADKVARQGVALLKQNAPGLRSIVKDSPSSNSDLETLTGDTVGGGLLDFKITAPTVESMSKALEQLTGEPLDKVSSALQNVTNQSVADLKTSLNTVVGKGLPVANDFLNEVGKFTSSLEAEINNIANGFTGQLKNLTEQFNGQLGPALNRITSGVNLPSTVKPEVARLLEQNKTAEAAQLLQRYSTLSLSQIENILDTVPVTMTDKVAKDLPLSAKTTRSTII